jgi:hypothetical protein
LARPLFVVGPGRLRALGKSRAVDVLRTLQASFAVFLLFAVAVGVGRPDLYSPGLTVFMVAELAVCILILERAQRRR